MDPSITLELGSAVVGDMISENQPAIGWCHVMRKIEEAQAQVSLIGSYCLVTGLPDDVLFYVRGRHEGMYLIEEITEDTGMKEPMFWRVAANMLQPLDRL